MQVTWNSDTGKVCIVGKHTRGVPRRWLMSLHVSNKNASEKIVIQPKGKLLTSDMCLIVDEHMKQFEAEHGEITKASWIATAR